MSNRDSSDYDDDRSVGSGGSGSRSGSDYDSRDGDDRSHSGSHSGSDYDSRDGDDVSRSGHDDRSQGSNRSNRSNNSHSKRSENIEQPLEDGVPRDENDGSENSDDDITAFYHDDDKDPAEPDAEAQRKKKIMLAAVCGCCLALLGTLGAVLGLVVFKDDSGSTSDQATVSPPVTAPVAVPVAPPVIPPTAAPVPPPTLEPGATAAPSADLSVELPIAASTATTVRPSDTGADTDSAVLEVGGGAYVLMDFNVSDLPEAPDRPDIHSDDFAVGEVFFDKRAILVASRAADSTPLTSNFNVTVLTLPKSVDVNSLPSLENATEVGVVTMGPDADKLELDVTKLLYPEGSDKDLGASRLLQDLESDHVAFAFQSSDASSNETISFEAKDTDGSATAPRVFVRVAKIRKDGPGNFTVIEDSGSEDGGDDEGEENEDDEESSDGNSTEVPSKIELIAIADTAVRDGKDENTTFGSDEILTVQYKPFESTTILYFNGSALEGIPEGSPGNPMGDDAGVWYKGKAMLTLHHIQNLFGGDSFNITVARYFVDHDNLENETLYSLRSVAEENADTVIETFFSVDPMDAKVEIDITDLVFPTKEYPMGNVTSGVCSPTDEEEGDDPTDNEKNSTNVDDMSGNTTDTNMTDTNTTDTNSTATNSTDVRRLQAAPAVMPKNILLVLYHDSDGDSFKQSASFRSREYEGGNFAPKIDIDVTKLVNKGCGDVEEVPVDTPTGPSPTDPLPDDDIEPVWIETVGDTYVQSGDLSTETFGGELTLLVSDGSPMSRALLSFDISKFPVIPIGEAPEVGEAGEYLEASAYLTLALANISITSGDTLSITMWRLSSIPNVETLTDVTLDVSSALGNITTAVGDADSSGIWVAPVHDLIYIPFEDVDAVNGNSTRNLRGNRDLQEDTNKIVLLLEIANSSSGAVTFYSREAMDGSMAAQISVRAYLNAVDESGEMTSTEIKLPMADDSA